MAFRLPNPGDVPVMKTLSVVLTITFSLVFFGIAIYEFYRWYKMSDRKNVNGEELQYHYMNGWKCVGGGVAFMIVAVMFMV